VQQQIIETRNWLWMARVYCSRRAKNHWVLDDDEQS